MATVSLRPQSQLSPPNEAYRRLPHYRTFSTTERLKRASSLSSMYRPNSQILPMHLPSKSKDRKDADSTVGKEKKPNMIQRTLNSKRSKASLLSISSTATIKPDDDLEERFMAKDYWLAGQKMRLHPYPDVPYPCSYDSVSLDNERSLDKLLVRLTTPAGHNSPHNPTFYSFHKPPATVLDLGCGQGHWLLRASQAWQSTQFTGFDLVDIALPCLSERKNIKMVRGNFLAFKLPFADASFEFVRMCNLALAIPRRWEFVLSEVYRVLKPGGRLELIDDRLVFPYNNDTAKSSNRPRSQSSFDTDDSDDDTVESSGSHMSYDSQSTLVDADPVPLKVGGKHVFPTHPSEALGETTWTQRAMACRELEQAFLSMLESRGYYTFPSAALVPTMQAVFGKGDARVREKYQLKLAPLTPAPASSTPTLTSVGSSAPSPTFNKKMKSLMGKKKLDPIQELDSSKGQGDYFMGRDSSESRTSAESTARPQLQHAVSAKAAEQLGIPYTRLASATAEAAQQSPSTNSSSSTLSLPSTSSQHPGIVVWPQQFIAIEPTELEMHACKTIHDLLGCRAALEEYMQSTLGDDGRPLLRGRNFDDWIWDYECFRRDRFHWPSIPDDWSDTETDIAQKRKSDPADPPHSAADISHSIHRQEDLISLRDILVYEAVKPA